MALDFLAVLLPVAIFLVLFAIVWVQQSRRGRLPEPGEDVVMHSHFSFPDEVSARTAESQLRPTDSELEVYEEDGEWSVTSARALTIPAAGREELLDGLEAWAAKLGGEWLESFYERGDVESRADWAATLAFLLVGCGFVTHGVYWLTGGSSVSMGPNATASMPAIWFLAWAGLWGVAAAGYWAWRRRP